MDYIYIIKPPEIAFECDKNTRIVSGLDLQLRKTKCFIKYEYSNALYHRAREDVDEGFALTAQGRKLYSFNYYSIPIRSNPYVKEI